MNYKIVRPPLSESFSLPLKEVLLKLKIGDLVKIMFKPEAGEVERMWVQITKMEDISEWTAKLDNDPVTEKMKEAVKAGDEVIFHPYDIIQIWTESVSIC